MTKHQEYRERAAEMVGLAQRANNTRDKARFLRIAETWLDLAAVRDRFSHWRVATNQPQDEERK